MRLGSSAAAAGAAAALVLASPASAFAAEGTFSYSYDSRDGHTHRLSMEDPPGKVCVPLGLPNDLDAAYAVENRTDAIATVFADDECAGDSFRTVPPGQKAPKDFLVRSVRFAH
ncbi:hypothetical protein [Streptomyces sp. MST-110588]|uniref:hypothetical protein n=1 Tax=Streptomyces sp. MST-110588 TaxID=2833628 RepID=UPI001F5E0685|nr:hypothetical protein [Streptomyces sp. MST-110588]UNO41282.1 hypothetical protein KGS77_19040 [Streptomyces sp. MST-110588]